MKLRAWRSMLLIILLGSFVPMTFANDESSRSLLQELEEAEARERNKNTYQGQPESAEETLKRARESAKTVSSKCDGGENRREYKDVKDYIRIQEGIQRKIAISIEQFTKNEIDKKIAIKEFNSLTDENNTLIKWGYGKVTNGTCGPKSQTAVISKSGAVTSNLFSKYRSLLE
jgi:hypothetical protein